MRKKVFCVGFQKTGTTSLSKALKILGYTVTGPNGTNDPEIEKNVRRKAFALVDKYDAFQDNPWPLLFKELDEKFPGNLFVLTLRDEDAWIKSVVRHFGKKDSPLFRWVYGVGNPLENEEIYLNRYKQHNKDVIQYFRNRPEDLLIVDFSKNNGWEELCRFLQCDIPNKPFPHANKAVDRERKNSGLLGFIKKLKRHSGYYFVRNAIKNYISPPKW